MPSDASIFAEISRDLILGVAWWRQVFRNACPETWLYQYKGSAVVRTGGTAITLEEGCCCTVTSGALPRTPQERAKPVPAPEALGLELWLRRGVRKLLTTEC